MLLLLALLVTCASGATIDQQIVNGVVATQHKWEAQLSLQHNNGWSWSHICGAVLLDNDTALTAAHCVGNYNTPGRYRIKCAAHNIHDAEDYREGVVVARIIPHESYNKGSGAFPNDIALMRLVHPVTKKTGCRRATLPTNNDDNFAGQHAVITGWGRTAGNLPGASRLKKGFVQVLSPSQCSSYWGSSANDQQHICVKDNGLIFGACNGDSGGPLWVGNTVTGLASWVASGCLVQYPSAYVRISNFLSWIATTRNRMR